MTTTKSDEEFATIRIKLGVVKRFRMLRAAYTQESKGGYLGMSEVMRSAADKALSEKGLQYLET